MAKYKKILVAYDGSGSAKNALKQACQLAREDKSWIKVLAVLPDYEGDLELVGISNIKDTMQGPGQKILAEAQQIADEEDVHILKNVEQGEPYERIVHVADEENCDLIIMGRRGRTHIERELIGGVTARVIGHTRKDVLVIPERGILGWKKILLASDGSPYSEAAEKTALNIARERKSSLNIVSAIYTNDEFFAYGPKIVQQMVDKAMERLDHFAKRAAEEGLSVSPFVKEGEPHEAVIALANDINASLIVMGTHGRKGLTRLLMGVVTEHVIGLASCPVLVSHIGKK